MVHSERRSPNFLTARTSASRRAVVGVDGGGTKTEAVILDARDQVLGQGIAGPSNPLRIGIANAAAAVREANNSANFIKAVEEKTGIKVEILSGIEEARLIGLAASHGCGVKGASTLNIDIGGGSTEISIFRDGLPTTLLSIKLGAVGLTERFLTSDPPRPKALEALRTEVHAALERPARELRDYRWDNVTGTSGTILAIGNALRLQSGGEQTLQPIETKIKLRDLTAFNLWLATKTVHERKFAARLTLPRAEIIVAGGLVLEGVMRALEIKSLSTCEWGLREGVIIDRLRDWEAQSRPPMPDIADQKLRGVHAVGRRFGYEEAHSHQVARLAETIFDALSSSANLTRHHARPGDNRERAGASR